MGLIRISMTATKTEFFGNYFATTQVKTAFHSQEVSRKSSILWTSHTFPKIGSYSGNWNSYQVDTSFSPFIRSVELTGPQMSGSGVFTTQDGNKFSGYWNEDLLAGYGEVTFDGVKYEHVGWTYDYPLSYLRFEPLGQTDIPSVRTQS